MASTDQTVLSIAVQGIKLKRECGLAVENRLQAHQAELLVGRLSGLYFRTKKGTHKLGLLKVETQKYKKNISVPYFRRYS
jgi:hypothetical protein